MADNRLKYPNLPDEARTCKKYRDDTANGLTRCVVDYAKLRGSFASRLNNQGVYRRGKYTRTTARRGLPDVLITRNGQSLFVEVKVGRDKLSEHQKKIQQEQVKAGGAYFTARDFEGFKNWFDGKE